MNEITKERILELIAENLNSNRKLEKNIESFLMLQESNEDEIELFLKEDLDIIEKKYSEALNIIDIKDEMLTEMEKKYLEAMNIIKIKDEMLKDMEDELEKAKKRHFI